jgi:hypothetical protein
VEEETVSGGLPIRITCLLLSRDYAVNAEIFKNNREKPNKCISARNKSAS